MESICFNRDWSSEKCIFTYPKREMDFEADSRIKQWVGKGIFLGVTEIMRSLNAGSCAQNSFYTHIQDALLDQVENKLKYYASKNNLTECARACLATCATSQLIQYGETTAFENSADILCTGSGICRHFSNLADSFMDALGIPAEMTVGNLIENGVDTGGHSWLTVTINRKKFWMEPQSDECKFYRIH